MSVAEAQSKIDSAEFVEWLVFYELEPFGEIRDDIRSGIVASTIANANRAKRGKAFNVTDFMPKFEEKRKKRTGAELGQIFKQYADAHNKAITRG